MPLYVLRGLSNDVVLGMNWLAKFNPKINWVDLSLCLPCMSICTDRTNRRAGGKREVCLDGIKC